MPETLPAGHIHARDVGDEHVGTTVTAEGCTGVLRDYRHLDDQFSQLIIGAAVITVGAGRPVAVT